MDDSRNLTFCINTARNERNHIELLFKSLYTNLSRRDYPIIVYVENDTQESTKFLQGQKAFFPNLRIIVNPLPVPIGYARNINLMFGEAHTDIVSYLQSDMVVCKNYDLEVLKFLTPDTIVSATRIEPPLHPPSAEKITHDFGLDPTTFNLEAFSAFAETCKKNEITDFWFAPFTLYKKVWLDIGGHDTLFRRSREDSDLLYRFSMKGLKIKQVWNALVYHFTCTSSRGPEWWTEKGKERARLQQMADAVEMFRFLRKWPQFKHTTTFDADKEYKYQVCANFYNTMPQDYEMFRNYHRFHRIYVDNADTRKIIRDSWKQMHNPANKLLNISDADWDTYKKYYRTWEYDDIYSDTPITDAEVIYNVDLKGQSMDTFLVSQAAEKMQEIVHENRGESGEFEIEGTGVKIAINNPTNHIRDNLIVKNPPIDDIKFVYL